MDAVDTRTANLDSVKSAAILRAIRRFSPSKFFQPLKSIKQHADRGLLIWH